MASSRRAHLDLNASRWRLAAAAGAILVAAALSPLVRGLVVIPLVLFLPGYAVMRAMGMRARFEAAHAVLASGLSMAIVVFDGLLLNWIGVLTPVGWAVSLGLATAAALGAGGAPTLLRQRRFVLAAGGLSVRRALMFAAALAICGASIQLSRERALSQREFLATEFWLVPAQPGNLSSLTIGVKNLEGEKADYDIELTLDGRLVDTWRSISLGDGETWTANAHLGVNAGAGGRAEAWLFKNHNRELVYRRAWADARRP